MSKKQILFALLLVDFVIFSVWATVAAGGNPYAAWLQVMGEPFGLQVSVDLVIACCIALGFIYPDARARGVAFWPFFAVTLMAGSIGLLAYLVARERLPRRAPAGPQSDGAALAPGA